jgi:DNA repair protein RadC
VVKESLQQIQKRITKQENELKMAKKRLEELETFKDIVGMKITSISRIKDAGSASACEPHGFNALEFFLEKEIVTTTERRTSKETTKRLSLIISVSKEKEDTLDVVLGDERDVIKWNHTS